MSTYAVSMDCPHATVPNVLWRVFLYDDVAQSAVIDREWAGHDLWVPSLETWTADTLRMVLHELSAYLPGDDTACGIVEARKRGGRPQRGQEAPRLAAVKLSVRSRGWTATVWTHRNEVSAKDGEYLGRRPGEWAYPMESLLIDLIEKSPFPLGRMRVVGSADRSLLDVKFPARRNVLRGVERVETPQRDSRKRRIENLIDEILDGDE